MLEHGAITRTFITEQENTDVLLFLHFGFIHLNNMITLVLTIIWLEPKVEIGSIRFWLYILSGLGGNILSSRWDILLAGLCHTGLEPGSNFELSGLYYM